MLQPFSCGCSGSWRRRYVCAGQESALCMLEAAPYDAGCMALRCVSKHRLLSGSFLEGRQCCAQVCELPSVLAYPLFYKLITPGETTVSHSAVRTWLAQRQITQVWQFL